MRPEPLLVQGEAESTRIDIAEANVDKAAAKVDTIKALVDQLTITAPIASQVYQIPVEEGEVVTPGCRCCRWSISATLGLVFTARGSDSRARGRRPVYGQYSGARQPRGHGAKRKARAPTAEMRALLNAVAATDFGGTAER